VSATAELAGLLSLAGRRVLVAGGGGGIGRAIVELFVAAGAEVVSVDRPGVGVPRGALAQSCDLSRADEVRALYERLGWERLDALVHAAGITRDAVLWKLDDEDWRDVLATNLDSAFYCLRGAVPLLRGRAGASVVLIASINGERGKFGQANYAASKAGLIALARTAARELGRFGVRVNALAPGLVRTAMIADLPPTVVARAEEESALGRLAEPEDVARAALFLVSDLARHVTGQVLRVDGGQLMA
jgi:acetoacetyl-CoA reductase/3-oxoacyl-[acyl-carrier protein] reductase